MSGDVDTSFGNSLINLAILKEVMHLLQIKGEVIVNGDDFILFTNKPVDIPASQAILKQFNMDTKMKPSTTNIHTVEFCTNKLVINSNGQPTLLKDIEKTYYKFGMTFTQVNKYRTYILENLHGNWMMMKTTPLGQSFKNLYFRTLKLERKLITKTQLIELKKKHRKLDYKYLERQFLFTIKEAAADREIKNNEITISMIMAFDETLDIIKLREKLYRKIKNIYDNQPNLATKHIAKAKFTRHILINHNTKTAESESY